MNVTPVRNKEINLSDLLWYLMSKWRKILLFAVIFAFVFGATKAIPSLYRLRSSAYAAVIQESNEKALQEYEEEKMMLEERQALIRQQLAELDEYAEKSPLFQINPRNVYVSEQVYYIDVEASPVSDKLSSEDSLPVYGAYRSLIFEAFSENTQGKQSNDSPFLDTTSKEAILTVTADDSNRLLTVRAIGASREEAEQVLKIAADAIAENKESISKTIEKHTMTLLSTNQYHTTSSELIRLHDEYLSSYEKLIKDENSVQDELNSLEKPVLRHLSVRAELKQAIKFAIIGFAIGGILSLFVFAVRFAVLAELASPEDITRSYGLEVLGVVPSDGGSCRFDRWINKHRGLNAAGQREELLKYAAASIHQLCDDNRPLLFVGTAVPDRIATLCEELKPFLPELPIRAMADPSIDADSLSALGESNAVILVEEIGKSRHANIIREMRAISRSSAEVLGFVLIGG